MFENYGTGWGAKGIDPKRLRLAQGGTWRTNDELRAMFDQGNQDGSQAFVDPMMQAFGHQNQQQLRDLGYTGQLYDSVEEGEGEYRNDRSTVNPEFQKWLADNGLTFKTQETAGGRESGLFQGDQQYGDSFAYNPEAGDSAFAAAMAGMGLFMAPMALGAAAAGGAGGGGGSLSALGAGAGYTVPGTGAFAGMSSAELAAISAGLGSGAGGAAGAAGASLGGGGGTGSLNALGAGAGYSAPSAGAFAGMTDAQLAAAAASGGSGAAGGGLGAANGSWDVGSGLGGGGSAAGGAGGLGGGAGGGGSGGGWMSSVSDWAKANPGLVNMGGGLVNGLIGSYSAGKAADAQTEAANNATALQRDIYLQNRADWTPYRELGTQVGVPGIRNLLNNPNSVLQDPGVKFQMEQGTQALDRSAASRGNLYSGAQMKASQRFGQDLASTALDRALARYGNAAQLGATGTQGTQSSATNFANQAGQNMMGAGNAQAGASLYAGNTWQNVLNQGLGQWNWNRSTYPDSNRGP